jgi:hypothetical protein
MKFTNGMPKMQKLHVVDSIRMPLSGCRISTTNFSNKFKASNALLNSAEYSIHYDNKERAF